MWQIDTYPELGKPLPDWFYEQPQIDDNDYFYLEAFQELSTCRSSGMGIGPIPWRDIIEYARMYGLCNMMQDVFLRVIRSMDNKFLEWYNKETERKAKKK